MPTASHPDLDARRERFPLGAAVTLADLSHDPYPLFHELRSREPVTWAPELGMWLLTRRDDVARVLGDPARFTTDSPASTIRDVFGRQMLSSDGADWIRYKRACMAPFRRIELERTLKSAVGGAVEGILDELSTLTEADLGRTLAGPLSLRAVLRVLGFPESDEHLFRRWYEDFAGALANFTGDEGIRQRGHRSAREFRDYVRPFLDGTRAAAEGGLVSALADSREDRLSNEEIVSNLLIVLFGGVETADSMIATCLWAILAHPEVRKRVARSRQGLARTVDEVLRWDAPVQSCTRFTTTPVEIRGVRIPEGETIQCMLGAANRDPAWVADPDRLDPERPEAGDHLSFGAGRHFCLGATMARLETETAVERFLDAFPDARLVDPNGARPRGHEFRKPARLMVRLRR